MREFPAKLGFRDKAFFASTFVLVVFFLVDVVFLLGPPGKIALARNHPDAEAVNLMGWVGFLAVIPWINALIWAFKPTDKIDIRRYPQDEAEATAAMIAKMKEDRASIFVKKPPEVKRTPAASLGTPSGSPDGDRTQSPYSR